MIDFASIQVGDVLWDLVPMRVPTGNGYRTFALFQVVVAAVDPALRRARVAWDGRAAVWWNEKRLRLLRRERPTLVPKPGGGLRVLRRPRQEVAR